MIIWPSPATSNANDKSIRHSIQAITQHFQQAQTFFLLKYARKNPSCCPPPIHLFLTQSPHRFITITFPHTPFPTSGSELPWEVLSWSNLLKESLMSVPNQIATLLDCYVSIQRIQSLLTCQVWVGLGWGGWGMEGIGGSGDWLRL